MDGWLIWVLGGGGGAILAILVLIYWIDGCRQNRQRATAKQIAKQYEECGRAKDAAFAAGLKEGREDMMGGYEIVTASEGYEFKITGLDGHPQTTREYREDACGNVSFDALPHAELSRPDIELVEIPKPEPTICTEPEPVVSVGVFCPRCGRGQKCHVSATRATYKAFTCQECSYRYEAK